MPRLRQVPRAEAPEDVQRVYDMLFGGRDPVAQPGTATGTPGNWWTVHANVPDMLRAFQSFDMGASKALPAREREIAIVRTGFLRESQRHDQRDEQNPGHCGESNRSPASRVSI